MPQLDKLILAQYMKLLDKADVSEEEVQQFLVHYPMFLPLSFPEENMVFSKLPLGNQHIVDFAFARIDTPGIRWHLIEIEKPQDKLFTRSGDPTARISHGIRQLHDWQTWFIENRDYVIRYFPFSDLMKEHSLCDVALNLIIGRRDSVKGDDRTRMDRLMGSGVTVMTFDRGIARMTNPLCDEDKPLRVCKFIGGKTEVISQVSVNVTFSIDLEDNVLEKSLTPDAG